MASRNHQRPGTSGERHQVQDQKPQETTQLKTLRWPQRWKREKRLGGVQQLRQPRSRHLYSIKRGLACMPSPPPPALASAHTQFTT